MTTAQTAQLREDRRELFRIAGAVEQLAVRARPVFHRHVWGSARLLVALQEAIDAAEYAAGRIEE